MFLYDNHRCYRSGSDFVSADLYFSPFFCRLSIIVLIISQVSLPPSITMERMRGERLLPR